MSEGDISQISVGEFETVSQLLETRLNHFN